MKIVDMHCHCAGVGAGESGCYLSPRMRNSWKYKFYLRGAGLTDNLLKSQGDRVSIQRIAEFVAESELVDGAVVLAMDGVIDETGNLDKSKTVFYIPDAFVAEETAHFDNLYFGASVNPYRRDALERLEWCKEHGAKLVKWLPSIQYINPSDSRLEPFYRKLKDLDLPLLSHAGDERSFTHAENSFSDPVLLRFPLQLGVKVIAAHMGSTGKNDNQDNMERTVALMREFPTLRADLSALTQINRKSFLYRLLKLTDLRDRVLFGTDFPLINMAVVSPYYFPFRLTWKQIRQIVRLRNPWDRDVALKLALGVPKRIFHNSAEYLGIQ